MHVQTEMRNISSRKYLYILLFVGTLIILMWYFRDSPRPVQHFTSHLDSGREGVEHHHNFHIQHHIPSPIDTHTSHNGETLFRSPQRKKPVNQRCLHSNPPVLEEEFTPSFKGSEGGYVCVKDYEPPVSWDINFNIERDFRFCTDRGHCKGETIHRIPKRLHFIWSTEVVPDVFVNNLKSFRKIHPKWKIHFWTIKHGRGFIKSREPQLLPYFDHYKREVDRADMLRYVILYYYGGAYFDLDSTPVAPLDDLIEKYTCIVGPEPIENAVVLLKTMSVLANSGIMCVSKHAFMRFLVDSLPIHGRRLAGPLFFSNCFNSYLRNRLNPPSDQGNHLKNNTTGTSLVESISVVRHEYFEFYLNNIVNVSGTMFQECPKYRSKAEQYIKDCKTYKGEATKSNCELPSSSKGWSTKLFQACVEWIYHGGRRRTIGKSQVYLKHIHYGTYTKTNFVLHHPGPNVSDILPRAILHVH